MKLEKTHRLISVTKKGIFFLTVLSLAFTVSAYISPGAPLGRVNDFADSISPETERVLSDTLSALDPSVAEVAVVTVRDLGGDSIENYANELFREWGIGQSESNNGVLFLIAIDDRKMRIEVGYGLEGVLTDLETFRIQEDAVKPYFIDGDYDKGIEVGVHAIISGLQGEFVSDVKQNSRGISGEIAFTILLFLIAGFQILFAILAPTRSWWLGGIVGGLIGIIVGLVLGGLFRIFLPIGSILLGLVFDYVVSKTYTKLGKPRKDFWSTTGFGSFGGGGFGGSGGGGFGGGSSGGGGSSSSW